MLTRCRCDHPHEGTEGEANTWVVKWQPVARRVPLDYRDYFREHAGDLELTLARERTQAGDYQRSFGFRKISVEVTRSAFRSSSFSRRKLRKVTAWNLPLADSRRKKLTRASVRDNRSVGIEITIAEKGLFRFRREKFMPSSVSVRARQRVTATYGTCDES